MAVESSLMNSNILIVCVCVCCVCFPGSPVVNHTCENNEMVVCFNDSSLNQSLFSVVNPDCTNFNTSDVDPFVCITLSLSQCDPNTTDVNSDNFCHLPLLIFNWKRW